MTRTKDNYLRALPDRLRVSSQERAMAKAEIKKAWNRANVPVLINIFQELLLDDLVDTKVEGGDWTPQRQACFDKLGEAVDACLFPEEKP